MADIIRDAAIGQIIRWATNNRYLQYPEEKPDFKLPDAWNDLLEGKAVNQPRPTSTASTIANHTSSSHNSDDETVAEPAVALAPIASRGSGINNITERRLEADEIHNIEKTLSLPVIPQKTKDGSILVDWYYTDDAEDPHNWTNGKRSAIALLICLYTFVVYTTSAIYTTSTEGIIREFGVSNIEASLGLSLYVLGYGVGPLIFSPLSEIPRIGRNPVYIITMFLFVILSIPTAFAPNFAGLMVLRFLQGFFGSPCLASGGASLGDMYSLLALPYAMMSWVSAAYCGRKFPIPQPTRNITA